MLNAPILGNDDLMVVGEYSRSSNNKTQNDRRYRDREKDDKEYERDRQHRSNKDRERERDGRNISADRGIHRSGRDRRSRSKEREKPWRNSDSNRRHERNREASPFYDGSKKGNNSRQSPLNQDAMSGLTVLENLRDRGVSRSPIRDSGNEKHVRVGGDSFNLLSREIQVKLVFYSHELMILQWSKIDV